MRLLLPIVFGILFLGWICYRLLIKKDLKENRNNLYVGLFFVGIWICIYTFIL